MGKIEINIQREERLEAINNLSAAVRAIAEALIVPVRVAISDCKFTGSDIGVAINTSDETDEEIIKECE